MGMFDRFIKTEQRSLENPKAPVSAENFLHIMGWGDFQSTAGVTVNIDNALGVPAVWAAVNFISGTLASLPLEFYRGRPMGLAHGLTVQSIRQRRLFSGVSIRMSRC